MNTENNYRRNEIILAIIASLFFLMYGIVPFALNQMDIYRIDVAFDNLVFSLISSAIPILLYFVFKKMPDIRSRKRILISESYILIIFIISLVIFYLFPWHDDRESMGASVAAVFRGLWLVLMVQCYGQSRAKILRLILYSIILMLVDQSRTAFGLALFVLGLSYSIYSIIFLIFLMSAAAAWRMGTSGDIVSNIMYGIIGEGYNGAKGALQALEVRGYEIEYLLHIFQLLIQPILTPFQIFSQKFGFADFDVTRHIGGLVEQYMSETYFPMGGFYISSEFIYYGYSGLMLLFLYLFIAFGLSKRFFDTSAFPMGSLVFIISIKASPYVFWKYVLYLYIIQTLLMKSQQLLKMCCNSFKYENVQNLSTK